MKMAIALVISLAAAFANANDIETETCLNISGEYISVDEGRIVIFNLEQTEKITGLNGYKHFLPHELKISNRDDRMTITEFGLGGTDRNKVVCTESEIQLENKITLRDPLMAGYMKYSLALRINADGDLIEHGLYKGGSRLFHIIPSFWDKPDESRNNWYIKIRKLTPDVLEVLSQKGIQLSDFRDIRPEQFTGASPEDLVKKISPHKVYDLSNGNRMKLGKEIGAELFTVSDDEKAMFDK